VSGSTVAVAFEHNGAQIARERFYAIACDPQRSVAVEACAGAGKTWMLVSRIVRAFLEGSAPHNILAITFTKKAAGEMRQRLQEWLIEFSRSNDAELTHALQLRGLQRAPSAEELGALRQLHNTLLHSGRPVQIRTFHSWFAALLRSAPLAVLQALKLPSQYELLENDAEAVAQVWRHFLARIVQDPVGRDDYFAAVAAHGRHQTHKALEAALAKRVEFLLADARGVVDTSVVHFATQFSEFSGSESPQQVLTAPAHADLFWAAARMLGASSLVTCTAAATHLEMALTGHDLAGVIDALMTQKGTPRKFSEKLAGIAVVRTAQELVARLSQALVQHEAWLHQHRMARLARGLIADFGELKRERGWIDMGDLERTALTLLSDPVLSGWVQERLDAKVRHLLIDEFQDTNPLQWQALHAWLSGYAGAGYAPSVFIVGDPKQSIYRFRRAEPQVFKAAKAFVVDGLGGDVLSCDHTRRNALSVTRLVNDVMHQAQDAGQFDGYRDHSTESADMGSVLRLPRLMREPALKSDPNSEATELPEWRDSLTTPRHEMEETRKVMECRQAAQWIFQQLADPTQGLRANDIMVLARKRERLGLMQAELASLRVPAQQPEKTELGAQPAVQDIVALLDALVSPRHDLSLARALKSPLFCVNDADLVELLLQQRALQKGLPKEAPVVSWMHVLQRGSALPPAIAGVGVILQRWKAWLDTMPPHDALSAIYEDGDVLARYVAAVPAVQGAQVLAQLRALLHAALQLNGGRYASAYALVRALRRGGIASPVLADAQAVRLLTIHGAKGLEAKLVVILDTDGEAPKSESMGVLVDWPGENAHPRRFAFLASESRAPASLAEVLSAEQTARRREELNALYVALTRTQNTLVISSTEPHSKHAASWWDALEPHAQDAPWPSGRPLVDGAVTSNTTAEVPLPDVLQIKILPNRPVAPVKYAQVAPESVAITTASASASASLVATTPAATAEAENSALESRIGQAMHRLLEWVAPVPQAMLTAPWSAAQQATLGQAFLLEAEPLRVASEWAWNILQGEGAWAWQTDALTWHGNEVPLIHRGRMLRIDRLVQQRSTMHWWVLDYKSSSAPQHNPEHCAQLLTYQQAVSLAYPEQVVRAAFLTPQGALIEIEPP
jgi:ATP-dependent helicase/nuclease subunit A